MGTNELRAKKEVHAHINSAKTGKKTEARKTLVAYRKPAEGKARVE